MPNANCFATLQLEPTTDLNLIKQAFRKQMMLHHPDKSGAVEQCQNIVAAWDVLKNEESRIKLFNSIQSNSAIHISQASEVNFWDISEEGKQPASQSVPSNKLVSFGVTLNVFIPMYVQKQNSYSQYQLKDDNDLQEMRVEKSFALNPYRFKTQEFDFIALAEVFNSNMEFYTHKQIGLDMQEVSSIVNQHSWYKRHDGYLGVSVRINIADITERYSEADVAPHCYNAGTARFLALKQGTKITSSQIQGLQLSGEDHTCLNLAGLVINNNKVSTPLNILTEAVTALRIDAEDIKDLDHFVPTKTSARLSPINPSPAPMKFFAARILSGIEERERNNHQWTLCRIL